MDRTAIFVDAGYLFAAGSRLIANDRLPRGELDLDHDALLHFLLELNAQITRLPLLRIYWYDGTSTGPNPQQIALAYRPNVKLRLGFVSQHGQQKGVDSLVITDLINLARNRAMADALLLTGDDDIRVGVQQAQEFGVRVHLIGIEPARENQSASLVQEADSVRELTLAEVQSFLARTASKSAPSASTPTAPNPAILEEVARQVAGGLDDDEVEAVLRSSTGGSVPTQIDRRLLRSGSAAMGGLELSSEDKRRIRAAFLDHCRSSGKSRSPGNR